jgi:hypothetical protein
MRPPVFSAIREFGAVRNVVRHAQIAPFSLRPSRRAGTSMYYFNTEASSTN